MFFVYILNCENKLYYVGYTDNLSRRLDQHRNKENIYTKKFVRVDLVYSEEYNKKQDAKDREIQLKSWTKEKKKALIDGNINKLKKLSKAKS
ncbi:MAG: GIY-YIG nuclease family protein [bacterium]|nr:GIY-YIG nuclease family protein [bacterium]